MNNSIFCLALVLISYNGVSQTYDFKTVKEIETTPIINQGNTGTC